jgi:hypothetical protein
MVKPDDVWQARPEATKEVRIVAIDERMIARLRDREKIKE